MDPEIPLKAVHMFCANIMQESLVVGLQSLEAQKKSLKRKVRKTNLKISTAGSWRSRDDRLDQLPQFIWGKSA